MILTGNAITLEYKQGKIDLQPYNSQRISTNAFDLTLGNRFIQYTCDVIDPMKPNAYREIVVGPEGILMEKNAFLLGHSVEVVGTDFFVGKVHAKSSIARLGLFVHATADLVHIGSHGNLCFSLISTLPVRLYPGMPIGQMTFWRPEGEITLYKGKYQGSCGPGASQAFRDFTASTVQRAKGTEPCA